MQGLDESGTPNDAPDFQLPPLPAHAHNTWGPPSAAHDAPLTRFVQMPFQTFNKTDRIGRIVDWLGGERYRKGDRYNERFYGSAANAGSQFDYIHDHEDANFQLVDSSKPQRPQRMFRRPMMPFRKMMQRDQERREQQYYNQSNKMKRSIAKEQMRAYKLWQRRGGMRGGGPNRGGMGGGPRRFGDRMPNKHRPASVQVRADWKVLQELDFQRLSKLSLPNREPPVDIPGETYGQLYYYDKALDKVSVKAPQALQRCGGIFYNTTTTEDPVIQKLAEQNEGNVFATDIILATLMAAQRSVYSWDIVAQRVGDMLFLDKRDTGGFSNPVDALTVSETSIEPPTSDPSVTANNAKDLATEALYINQNFRRQVLKRSEKPVPFNNERAPFEDEAPDARAECAYRYRKWSLGSMADGTPINVVARTELDGAMISPSGNTKEPLKLTIKAFNEWDSTMSGGVQWRSKLDMQKAAVLATEMKNNGSKLSKWTLQSLLAGADYLKFGYVSRVNVRNSAQHEVLGTQQFKPSDFANSINLNLDNCWGVLRVVCEILLQQPTGKYLLLKDPSASVVRIYTLPEGTFDSGSDEEDEQETESEEED